MTPEGSLTLTARLNISAVGSRRGVVRLHPNVIAALGIRGVGRGSADRLADHSGSR
jgi:hypothetical protein